MFYIKSHTISRVQGAKIKSRLFKDFKEPWEPCVFSCTYRVQIVVEIYIASTQVSAQQGSMSGEDCWHIYTLCTRHNQTHACQPFMEVCHYIRFSLQIFTKLKCKKIMFSVTYISYWKLNQNLFILVLVIFFFDLLCQTFFKLSKYMMFQTTKSLTLVRIQPLFFK